MNTVDILDIFYGKAVPLVNPKQQLGEITALAIPNPFSRGSKVCFVEYDRIIQRDDRRILKLIPYTGRALLDNECFEIVEKSGKWFYCCQKNLDGDNQLHIPIFVLTDVTKRLHLRMSMGFSMSISTSISGD